MQYRLVNSSINENTEEISVAPMELFFVRTLCFNLPLISTIIQVYVIINGLYLLIFIMFRFATVSTVA